MKVKATKKGFYGGRIREVGESFELTPRIKGSKAEKEADVSQQFSELWMQKTSVQPAVKISAKKKPMR